MPKYPDRGPFRKKLRYFYFRSPNQVILQAIDVLATIALFYNFASWGGYQTTEARLLGLFACFYVTNGWLTSHSTFNVYSLRIFIIDTVTIFLYAYFPTALGDSSSIWGYSPVFWLVVGLSEFLYIIWDVSFMKLAPSETAQRNLGLWALTGLFSTVMGVGLFIFLSISTNLILGHLFSILAVIFILGLTFKWNFDRYKRAKNEGISFFDT